jgi:plasmid stabilization system protein ParE
MNLRFLPAAREELDAATSYLEDRIQGLGEEFLEDVERTGTLLRQFPQIGRRLDAMHRAIPLQRFSFNLVYRVVDGQSVIVAVAHKRRRPGYWHRRFDR